MEALLAPSHVGVATKRILLRVTAAAWQDLGIPVPARLDREATPVAEQPILRKFWDHCSKAENLNTGTRIAQLVHPKVFRLKAGAERAATWYDEDAGVIWLLRILSLAKFHDEDGLYRHFAALEQRQQLMPSGHEAQLARGQQYFVNMRMALAEAMSAAAEEPDVWRHASIERQNGDVLEVGRTCVQLNDELTVRHLIVPRYDYHPDDIRMPRAWLESVAAKCFPLDEPIEEAYHDLPFGANVQQDREHSLVQLRLEQR